MMGIFNSKEITFFFFQIFPLIKGIIILALIFWDAGTDLVWENLDH